MPFPIIRNGYDEFYDTNVIYKTVVLTDEKNFLCIREENPSSYCKTGCTGEHIGKAECGDML